MSDEVKPAETNRSGPSLEELTPLDNVLTALINEVVRSRVRNRALLRLLVERDLFEMREYVETYTAEEEASFEPLLDMLMMPPDEFRKTHGAWLENERTQYGYRANSYPSVELIPHALSELENQSEAPPTATAKKKKPRRKVS